MSMSASASVSLAAAMRPSGDASRSRMADEPKYDRIPLHRASARQPVYLQSRNQKPLERYIPEVARAIEDLAEDDFVLDGDHCRPLLREPKSFACTPPRAVFASCLATRRPSSSSSTFWRDLTHRCSNGHWRAHPPALRDQRSHPTPATVLRAPLRSASLRQGQASRSPRLPRRATSRTGRTESR